MRPLSTPASTADAPVQKVLDADQLRRIENVHKGFLYQHLYGVACLLKLASAKTGSVGVERDEDIEVTTEACRFYVQVKYRSAPLTYGEIADALTRFSAIREEHAQGRRNKVPHFRIVANAAPSPALQAEIEKVTWPTDVSINSPEQAAGPLPESSKDIPSAFASCLDAASTLPFGTMRPETLVLKLAARIQYAASGTDADHSMHTFNRAELPALFEQLVEQLQDFPVINGEYWPQMGEPEFEAVGRATLIVGFSGAGKTAWAAHGAHFSGAATVYFDIADLPGAAIASSLARELAARFMARGSDAALLPAGSGIEMLRALNQRIDLRPSPIVVVDNVHKARPEDLAQVVEACSRLRFIFLAQPWPGQRHAEAILNVSAATLDGWDNDTIASVFAARGARMTPAVAERWRSVTGGMPLFVGNAAQLTATAYGGDAARFVADMERENQSIVTAQEAILRRVVEALSVSAKRALAVLTLSTVPLTREEVDALFESQPAVDRPRSAHLRELASYGAVQFSVAGEIKVHDALRPLGIALQHTLGGEATAAARARLCDTLLESLEKHRDLARFGLWLRLLATTGKIETLVDLATSEYFHEAGDPSDLKVVLEAAAVDENLSDVLRFWTLDALAFWDWQAGDRTSGTYGARLDKMRVLANNSGFGNRERVGLAMKLMMSAAIDEKDSALAEAFAEAKGYAGGDAMLLRIVRYNYAFALFKMNHLEEVEKITFGLQRQYYGVLGLTPGEIVGKNPPEIIRLLRGGLKAHQDDLKHLADCLDLYARACRAQGKASGLAWLHAMKFYAMSGAYRSAVRAGQDAADDFILLMGDADAARDVLEQHVLPVINAFGLTDAVVEARSFYAVILAYVGDIEGARHEMQRLQPFASGLLPEHQEGLNSQIHLIEQIAAGKMRLHRRPLPPMSEYAAIATKAVTARRRVKSAGRNDPCPCGSGLKYKKCHGA
ncbi:MAG: SEC-C metal-binding domain-containing protein [Gammaproteobacteria bacterium]